MFLGINFPLRVGCLILGFAVTLLVPLIEFTATSHSAQHTTHMPLDDMMPHHQIHQYITLTPNFTAFVTSHGKTKSYLHRFNIIESPDCPCGGGSQTVDHLLIDCTILQEERERLIGKISRHDNWPVNKSQLGNKYIKHFIQFTNSIDFTKL